MLLPRGLPVVYVVETNEKEWMKAGLEERGISAHITEKWTFICGFVVNDTEEDGYSVAAVDNSEVCLTKRNANDRDINQVREYILNTGSYDREVLGEYTPFSLPICQFS